MTDSIDTMLAKVKRLDAEATPGGWRTEPDPGYECYGCGERDEQAAIVRSTSGAGLCVVLVGDRDNADAESIVYYRTAAPLLAQEVERLQAEVERYRGAYAGAIDALEYALAAHGAFVHADDENGMTMLYDCLRACERQPELKATLDAGIRDLAAKGGKRE